jgi:predicted RNase H-like HicB family nuclease
MKYTVLLVRDPEGGYVVRVPALRGCVTEGDSLPDALDNAREAILAYLGSLAKDGLRPPADTGEISLYEDEDEAMIVRLTVEEVAALA